MVAHASVIGAYSASSSGDYDNTQSFVGFYEGPSGTTLETDRASSTLSVATHPGNDVTYIAASVFNNTNNIVYLNGTAQTAVASTGTFDSTRLLIGARWVTSGLGNFYNGNVAEIIIFNRALKTEERKSIESYLGKKWGVKIS